MVSRDSGDADSSTAAAPRARPPPVAWNASPRTSPSAFLLKDADPESIVSAVHAVAAGHTLVTPELTRRLVARWTVPRPAATDVLAALTAREVDVLTLVARGRTNREIAAELTVEESTVKTHIGRLLAKMQARDRVHLVIQAYAAGRV